MKKVPVGISDFEKIISNNYYYVDKTLLVKEILENGAQATLIPRPRRFGKTLNMSMSSQRNLFLMIFQFLNIKIVLSTRDNTPLFLYHLKILKKNLGNLAMKR